MVIDIQPAERQPTEHESLILDVYGYKRMYCFMQGDKQYSVHWTDETIKEFLPNLCVSEYIDSHDWDSAHTFIRCKYFWDKQLHPYWTREEGFVNGRRSYRQVPMSLTEEYVKRSALHWMKNAYKQFCNPITFVVINNPVFNHEQKLLRTDCCRSGAAVFL